MWNRYLIDLFPFFSAAFSGTFSACGGYSLPYTSMAKERIWQSNGPKQQYSKIPRHRLRL